MSDDIVERLRGCAASYNLDLTDTQHVCDLTDKAADEIERLKEIETWADGARIQLAEAYGEIERLQTVLDTAEVLVEHKDAEIERLRGRVGWQRAEIERLRVELTECYELREAGDE